MKTNIFPFFSVFFFFVMISSCTMCSTKTEEESATEEINDAMNDLKEDLKKAGKDAEGSISDAVNKMEETMEQLKKDGKVVEPVNFRVLKSGIPETFLGMERTKNEGETTGAMGFKVSTAKAVFQDGDKKVEFEIFDVGGIGMAAIGMAAWAMAEVDKESDSGFERTTTFQGHKAYEKCNGKRCEFSTWMGQRIIFNVKSYNVDFDDLKKGVKKEVDFDDLMDSVEKESK